MTTGDENSAPPPTSSSPSTITTATTTWKLPEGIEEHIYSGLVKTAVGAISGAAIGAVMFRSGKGWRAASMAGGVGVALGSTVERAMADSK